MVERDRSSPALLIWGTRPMIGGRLDPEEMVLSSFKRSVIDTVRRLVGTDRLLSLDLDARITALERCLRYLAIADVSRQYAAESVSVDLRLAERKVFSQNGEDGVICSLLRTLGEVPEFFVEFGVGDGSECNTRFLAEVLGWSGLYMEMNLPECDSLAQRYANTQRVRVQNVQVTAENIGDLFRSSGVPHDFGVLSIDVDGQDIWLWRALPDEWRPALIVIEYNSALDRLQPLAEPPGSPIAYDASFGASIGAIGAISKEKGYRLIHTEVTGVNAFLVDERHGEALPDARGILDRSPNFYLTGSGHRADSQGPRPINVLSGR